MRPTLHCVSEIDELGKVRVFHQCSRLAWDLKVVYSLHEISFVWPLNTFRSPESFSFEFMTLLWVTYASVRLKSLRMLVIGLSENQCAIHYLPLVSDINWKVTKGAKPEYAELPCIQLLARDCKGHSTGEDASLRS